MNWIKSLIRSWRVDRIQIKIEGIKAAIQMVDLHVAQNINNQVDEEACNNIRNSFTNDLKKMEDKLKKIL